MTTPTPSGYKSTKLWLIPNDWEILKLGKIWKIITWKTPSTKNSNFWAENWYMFITPTDISEDNYWIYQTKTTRYLTEEGKKYSWFIPENSLLITCIASIWKIAISKNNSCFNQQINAIIPNKDYSYLFLYYQFQNNKKKLMSYAWKVAVPIINKSLFESLELFWIPPSHVEQQKIADILSSVDVLIDETDTIISQQKKLKKWLLNKLMTEWIWHTDFVSHPKLGKLPKQWKVVKLGEIFKRIDRKNNNISDNILTISAINWLIKQQSFFNKLVASKNIKNYILLEKWEFSYNKSYSNWYPYWVIKRLDLYEQWIVSSLYIGMWINSDEVFSDFYKYYFDIWLNFIMPKIAQEGSRNHWLLNVSIKEFFEAVVILPPLPEQQRIAEILGAVDTDIEREQNYKNSLLRLKHGLMQKLLTGKIRVKF